jgi:hypothetical protein
MSYVGRPTTTKYLDTVYTELTEALIQLRSGGQIKARSAPSKELSGPGLPNLACFAAVSGLRSLACYRLYSERVASRRHALRRGQLHISQLSPAKARKIRRYRACCPSSCFSSSRAAASLAFSYELRLRRSNNTSIGRLETRLSVGQWLATLPPWRART